MPPPAGWKGLAAETAEKEAGRFAQTEISAEWSRFSPSKLKIQSKQKKQKLILILSIEEFFKIHS